MDEFEQEIREMLIRENGVCFICGIENKWNKEAANLIKDIKDPLFKHEKLVEFWKKHSCSCLVIKECGIIRFVICKKHLQDEIDKL